MFFSENPRGFQTLVGFNLPNKIDFMSNPKEIFETDVYYHVFNKSVGEELLFQTEDNYFYFLSLIQKQLNPFVNFYSYCLMPNHFHFLIQIKNDEFFSVENGFENEKSVENISILFQENLEMFLMLMLRHSINNKTDRVVCLKIAFKESV